VGGSGGSESALGIVKQDFAGGVLPSGKFGSNSCWLACFSMNMTIYVHPRMTDGTSWLRVRMKSI